ncbi:PglZ domain-containing protein [Bacteroidota bacterium]
MAPAVKQPTILWVDDEIDLLKPHVIFLENKGFFIVTATNGSDALEEVKQHYFDLIFLDENMPGLSGLETLNEIKQLKPEVPVVMVTKSEEENIMDEAIGLKISDYLIKPVNPNQLLLSIKKNLQTKELISQKTITNYQQEFSIISQLISTAKFPQDWIYIYKKLVSWELLLQDSSVEGMNEILKTQFYEGNHRFLRFIKNNYLEWFLGDKENKPVLSQNLFKEYVFPLLDNGEKVVFILIDNLRYDQWKILQPVINQYFDVKQDDIYYSILPTATQYSRNAIFSGLMPLEIEHIHSDLWVGEDVDEMKNLHEEELLRNQINRYGKNYSFNYEKINNLQMGQKLVQQTSKVLQKELSVIIFNFVDMMSHARTDRQMMRELANDESAYCSLTLSWFKHSPLFEFLKEISNENVKVILTTDHGSIRVFNPVKVIGDKSTSSNLRYKMGKNLNYNPKQVFEVKHPHDAHLPVLNLSSRFIFCSGSDFFAYPNNYNYYVNYYKNTFQHGGISMEEMLIPIIQLNPV